MSKRSIFSCLDFSACYLSAETEQTESGVSTIVKFFQTKTPPVQPEETLAYIFNARVMPPKQASSIELHREQPGWITFSIDGRYAYPSTGEVIDVKTRKIIAGLKDEHGADVHSEKLLEIDFNGDQPVRTGDQFGIGRVKRRRS